MAHQYYKRAHQEQVEGGRVSVWLSRLQIGQLRHTPLDRRSRNLLPSGPRRAFYEAEIAVRARSSETPIPILDLSTAVLLSSPNTRNKLSTMLQEALTMHS